MLSYNTLRRWWSQVAILKLQLFTEDYLLSYLRKTFKLTMTASYTFHDT